MQKRLNTLVLVGEDYAKIEKLVREVDRAQNLLRSLGAPNQLTQDFEMVGRLIAKQPKPYQAEWDRHITTPSVTLMEGTDWQKFTQWLERQKGIAVSARLRAVAVQQALRAPVDNAAGGKGGAGSGGTGNTQNRDRLPFYGVDGCWKCGANGHLGRNCTAQGKELHTTWEGTVQQM